jgi:rRNA maturation endonuclease Nob1
MTPKLHNVPYPNVCGRNVGLILDLHIVGLITTKYCAANCKWEFVCWRAARIFAVFMLRICVLCNMRDFKLAAVLRRLSAYDA